MVEVAPRRRTPRRYIAQSAEHTLAWPRRKRLLEHHEALEPPPELFVGLDGKRLETGPEGPGVFRVVAAGARTCLPADVRLFHARQSQR